MISDAQKSGVIKFYDTHPINEVEILAKLAARGISSGVLTEDDLKDFDQDHYGGTEALDTLADIAGIRRDHHVLDVCCLSDALQARDAIRRNDAHAR